MATKKQQRRRAKERRHEYEVVYVDEDGNEVEAPPDEDDRPARPAAGGKAATGKQPAKKGQGRRPAREVKPPSWRRAAIKAAGLGVVMFLVLGLGSKHAPLVERLGLTILYAGAFAPTLYWIDRIAYRRYQRAAGQAPPPTRKK